MVGGFFMSTLFQCDRCNKVSNDKPFAALSIKVIEVDDPIEVEICNACFLSLDTWRLSERPNEPKYSKGMKVKDKEINLDTWQPNKPKE